MLAGWATMFSAPSEAQAAPDTPPSPDPAPSVQVDMDTEFASSALVYNQGSATSPAGAGSIQYVPPVSAAVTVNTSTMAGATAAYMRLQEDAQVETGWTGSLSSCSAGTISASARNAGVDATNVFRAWVGLGPVSDTNATWDKTEQNRALVASANNHPTADFTSADSKCASVLGGALTFNDVLDKLEMPGWVIEIVGRGLSLRPGEAVMHYMSDQISDGASPTDRSTILFPGATTIAQGATPTYSYTLYNTPTVAVPVTSQAWPAPGYFPIQLLPSGGTVGNGQTPWSVQSTQYDLSSAKVSVSLKGANQPITNFIYAPYGPMQTISWQPTSLPTPAAGAENDYAVTISGLKTLAGAAAANITYTVKIYSAPSTTVTAKVPPTTSQGEVLVGSTVTATISGLTPSNATLAYQWYEDCNTPNGKTIEAIPGATAKSYTPTASLLKSGVSCLLGLTVTARANGYATTYTWSNIQPDGTSRFWIIDPQHIVMPPTVSLSTATVGKPSAPAFGATPANDSAGLKQTVSKKYQWYLAATPTATGTAIAAPAGTASTYTPTLAQAGQYLWVVVTFSSTGDTSTPVKSASVKSSRVPVLIRDGGADRFSTAVTVTKQGWTSASTVYLAYGYTFPDALAGVSLAGVNGAPVLLTGTDAVPDSTMSELKALGAKNVVLLGGTAAISAKVEKQLTTAKYSVTRIAGIDRYDTAAQIGKQVLAKSKATTAVIATGTGWADALSMSPVAGMKGWPVLFANGNTLPKATSDFIKANKIKTVYIVGGTGAIGTAVESALKKAGVTTITRLAGTDRYDTSVKIATKFKSSFTSSVSVATGVDFPDALAGGALSAKLKIPMLLLHPTSGASTAEKTYVKGLKNPKIYVYGGTSALTDAKVITLLS